ncbi:MAG TPA: hypothetical protein VG860_09135 [Terriglobia bacterium]|jgi:hypothetical protein|nr:hypothetical protein [Terriglobia bacterium]
MRERLYFRGPLGAEPGMIIAALLLSLVPAAFAQTTISTGSIEGTITDSSRAVVPGASIDLTTTPGLRTNRTLFGSGVFAFGGPRSVEWGLKVTF